MKPDIYSYTSAVSFLIDTYKYLKTTSESSSRTWAERMGFDSPSLVMDILKRKRPLKLKFADNFANGMGLNFTERLYFKTLIQIEKSNDEEKVYLQEVLKNLSPQDIVVDKEGGIYSHWLNVVIFTLSQMDDFSMSVSEIQSSLKLKVPLHSIEESLDILVSHHLLEKSPQGHYKRCHNDRITTPNDVSIKTTHSYYRQIISKSQSAIDMGVDEREFQCFAIGMKKENLAKVKEVMRNARKEISSFWDEHGDHVYQFNLNGFPMAEIRKADEDVLN